jgi:hypothetical protein
MYYQYMKSSFPKCVIREIQHLDVTTSLSSCGIVVWNQSGVLSTNPLVSVLKHDHDSKFMII